MIVDELNSRPVHRISPLGSVYRLEFIRILRQRYDEEKELYFENEYASTCVQLSVSKDSNSFREHRQCEFTTNTSTYKRGEDVAGRCP